MPQADGRAWTKIILGWPGATCHSPADGRTTGTANSEMFGCPLFSERATPYFVVAFY